MLTTVYVRFFQLTLARIATLPLTVLLTMACLSVSPLYASSDTDKYIEQRALYNAATQAFEKGDLKHYQQLKAQLTTYPLYPYLEYAELSQALDLRKSQNSTNKYGVTAIDQSQSKAITNFIEHDSESYLANRLLSKWLYYLAEQKNWRDYKRYYQANVKKTELECFHLQAQVNTGEALDVASVDRLWLSSQSQPNECDPIFSLWEKQGHLTQEKLWQRYTLTVNKNNHSLSSYIQKKMAPSTSYLADLYKKLHSSPEEITRVNDLSSSNSNKASNDITISHINDIIEHGLYRYAYYEPQETYQLLRRFEKKYAFSHDTLQRLRQRITDRLIRTDDIDSAMVLLEEMGIEERGEQTEALLRKLLAQQQWGKINTWIDRLPKELLASDRWQYWKARTLETIGRTNEERNIAKGIYENLANSRSFYGFLAADKQAINYQFEDKPASVNPVLIKKIQQSAAFSRAKEFFLMGEMHQARTEWRYAINDFSSDEFIAAAQVAHQWGWNRKAIEAMAGAAYWDDLTIRFPIAHQHIIHQTAQQNNIPSSLVFSIARQESAWEFDATSSVGARGLMQLMPATAKQTAKKARLAYQKSKLFEPEYNIALGSHYISGLLNEYGDNRALAIASYNAGPHRVKQWLKKTNASLPLDLWIEIIPFKETRKYVQNVLSYEVIYNYLQGKESTLLTLAEANTIL